MAGLAAIGFTVSIFITGLAFEHPLLIDRPRSASSPLSLIAAGLGALILG